MTGTEITVCLENNNYIHKNIHENYHKNLRNLSLCKLISWYIVNTAIGIICIVNDRYLNGYKNTCYHTEDEVK